ncbi:MAG: 50S ribosomal protein L25 [Candidatus Doudnabacteria bacterium]|nr:50S ribosomal protein L25 [Candidatus Doudnabacteria bacterium]
MENIAITATKREVSGKKVQTLRAAGKLPAVVYGHNTENKQLEINEKEFTKAFKSAGESTLVNLTIDGKSQPVLIHDVQHHYLSGKPIHVDFYAVNMTEKLKVKVPVHFLGESPAVKAMGGTLVKNLSEIEVECLPGDIPQAFEVDISILNTFEDAIRVSSVKVAKEVTVITPADEVLVTVSAPRTEEEMNALNAEIKEDVTAVEGVVKPEPVVGADEKKKEEKE